VIREVTQFKFFIAVIPGTETVLFDFRSLSTLSADHGGRAALGMNILRSLERWDRGFESHSEAWMFLCAVILFVLSCV
jgi:hypothetical protein